MGDFNPRTPCGVRQDLTGHGMTSGGFQSTHPVWGATRFADTYPVKLCISIHAPRVGCDGGVVEARCQLVISIHAPRVG